MVILNTEILVDKNTLQYSIKELMKEVMVEYFNKEMLVENVEKKRKMMISIIEEKVQTTKTNNFWYFNFSKNICTYIHKRGKREGHMCHTKIHTNIGDNKPDYLCSKHSKLHIPKKREKMIKNTKKRKDIKKTKKIYISNNGNINLGKIIEKLLNN